MKHERENKKFIKGFTLIELLVVVLIIGILAGIALPQYEKSVWKARLAEVYTVTNALEKSIETYILTHTPVPEWDEGKYLDPEELDIDALSNLTEKTIGDTTGYCSKYVCYYVECFYEVCDWYAFMYTNSENEDYFAEMIGSKSSSGWYKECNYEDKKGEMFCKLGNWDAINEGF